MKFYGNLAVIEDGEIVLAESLDDFVPFLKGGYLLISEGAQVWGTLHLEDASVFLDEFSFVESIRMSGGSITRGSHTFVGSIINEEARPP